MDFWPDGLMLVTSRPAGSEIRVVVFPEGSVLEARLPLLSTYLGHVSPASTYWYLSAAPELLALAGQRLEHALEQLS